MKKILAIALLAGIAFFAIGSSAQPCQLASVLEDRLRDVNRALLINDMYDSMFGPDVYFDGREEILLYQKIWLERTLEDCGHAN